MQAGSNKIVLTIAGFDPCGGAGILADVQTIQQLGAQGMAVVSALTYQNEDGFYGIEWKNFESIKAQLDPIINRYPFDTVKIGIVQSMDILNQTIDLLQEKNKDVNIIWDPVLKSSSGFDFSLCPDKQNLKEVLGKIYLITPNKLEFDHLTRILPHEEWSTNCLLKGGHNSSNDVTDLLMTSSQTKNIEAKRIEGRDKHGTGCVLSSALATYISQGTDLETACRKAKRYIEKFLMTGKEKLGRHFEVKI
ncbi:MAG: hydroxymethylpyrimidine/phosphomethylpyrimidine kinase [Cyclobacteriaceae bacterium]